MIESPLLQEIIAETKHDAILRFLNARFGPVPTDIVTRVRTIDDAQQLDGLFTVVAQCPDLEALRTRLQAE